MTTERPKPLPVHYAECIDGWAVDPDDGARKPRRLMKNPLCICSEIGRQRLLKSPTKELLELAGEIEHGDPPTPHAWARRLRELAGAS